MTHMTIYQNCVTVLAGFLKDVNRFLKLLTYSNIYQQLTRSSWNVIFIFPVLWCSDATVRTKLSLDFSHNIHASKRTNRLILNGALVLRFCAVLRSKCQLWTQLIFSQEIWGWTRYMWMSSPGKLFLFLDQAQPVRKENNCHHVVSSNTFVKREAVNVNLSVPRVTWLHKLGAPQLYHIKILPSQQMNFSGLIKWKKKIKLID